MTCLTRKPIPTRGVALAALAGAMCLALAGCSAIPRTRTLPDEIRSVYIPLFKNETYEPNVEEDLTRALEEVFLEDGRVLVEGEKEADMVIVGVVTGYRENVRDWEEDEFPRRTKIRLEAEITAYNPYDYDRQFPMGTWKRVRADYEYDSNTRRTSSRVAPDFKREALEELAESIWSTLMYEMPDDLDEVEERRMEAEQTLRDRHPRYHFRKPYITW